jgi:aspartate/methionine/tyrosine aminotransferase
LSDERHGPPLAATSRALAHSAFAEFDGPVRARIAAGHAVAGLHIGDTYFAPPEAAQILALAQQPALTASSAYRYGTAAGSDALRAAIRQYYTGRYHELAIDDANILLGAGGTCALSLAMRATLNLGDEVLVFSPHWPLATGILRSCGATPVAVQYTTEVLRGHAIDLKLCLEAARSTHTRGIYFANPNNPDGYVYRAHELAAIGAFAREHNLWVYSDEVYADFTYNCTHLASSIDDHERRRTITLHSLSKSHGLAGLRVGFAVANATLVAAARRLATHDIFNVPLISQVAAMRALEHGGDWLKNARSSYAETRARAIITINAAGIPHYSGPGGTYLWLDLASTVRDNSITPFLLELLSSGVLLAPGSACDAWPTGAPIGECVRYHHFARLCFTAVPPAELDSALQRLCEVYARWNQGHCASLTR